MKSRYASDRGLTARMTGTMFLLGLLYVVFIAVLIAIGLNAGRVVPLRAGEPVRWRVATTPAR